MPPRLILASASPRRLSLLLTLGVPFTVVPSEAEEIGPAGLPPFDLAVHLALVKAREVAGRHDATQPAVVLGADTLVVVDGCPLGKPGSREEARVMLRRLRGRAHEVVTGLALVPVSVPDVREVTERVVAEVVMRAYGDGEIEAYLDTGEPDDKAGAYGVQGEGGRLVAEVRGCRTTVVGLPLRTTARLLRAFGLTPTDPP